MRISEIKSIRQRRLGNESPILQRKERIMKTVPNSLFVDFQKGKGFFEGDWKAQEVVRKLSKNQKRKMERHGTVPTCFFQYLARINVIKECDVPKEAKTKGWLLEFLRFYRYASEQARSAGEYLYREIIKGEIPWLAKSFGQGDYVWSELEESMIYVMKKPRNA